VLADWRVFHCGAGGAIPQFLLEFDGVVVKVDAEGFGGQHWCSEPLAAGPHQVRVLVESISGSSTGESHCIGGTATDPSELSLLEIRQ
jgi:hypothetical protein